MPNFKLLAQFISLLLSYYFFRNTESKLLNVYKKVKVESIAKICLVYLFDFHLISFRRVKFSKLFCVWMKRTCMQKISSVYINSNRFFDHFTYSKSKILFHFKIELECVHYYSYGYWCFTHFNRLSKADYSCISAFLYVINWFTIF